MRKYWFLILGLAINVHAETIKTYDPEDTQHRYPIDYPVASPSPEPEQTYGHHDGWLDPGTTKEITITKIEPEVATTADINKIMIELRKIEKEIGIIGGDTRN